MNGWRMTTGTGMAAAVLLAGRFVALSSAQQTRTGEITGRVVDAAGATINQASVYVGRNLPSAQEIKLMTRTDNEGNFKLVLPEGGYDVLITVSNFRAQVATVPVEAGKTQKLQFRLKSLGCGFPGAPCDSVQ
jgi:hypothetical protein